MLTVGELKTLLTYDTSTGKFTWNSDRTSTVRKGDIAGTKSQGYTLIGILGKSYQAHRLAWLYVNGDFPNGQLDHINGVSNDNRICNLREVCGAENSRNTKHRIDNTSGHMGVGFQIRGCRWSACIGVKGKTIYLGRYDTKEEAVAARKAAEMKYGFHANHGRKSNNQKSLQSHLGL